ncbi:MAG: glycoside hydrolase family 36 N-terminal domain-containing protein, partial [Leucothrix sp.]
MSLQLFRLDSRDCTLLLLSIDQAIPAVGYYGEKLNSDLDAESMFMLSADAIPNAKLDERTQLSLLPENSRGFFGEPGLQGHRNGQNFTHRFTLSDTQQSEHSLRFTAIDDTAALRLHIAISLDKQSNVFSWQHSLTNLGDTDYTLDYLACPTLPL